MLPTALLLVAFILFVLAAFNIDGRLVPAGLACWVLSLLVGVL